MDKVKKSSKATMHKTKICNFDRSGLGGYLFTFVTLCEKDNLEPYQYFFEADTISVDIGGNFVSGAVLTYAPYRTLEEAMKRWNEFGGANVESENGAGIEELARKAIEACRKRKTF